MCGHRCRFRVFISMRCMGRCVDVLFHVEPVRLVRSLRGGHIQGRLWAWGVRGMPCKQQLLARKREHRKLHLRCGIQRGRGNLHPGCVRGGHVQGRLWAWGVRGMPCKQQLLARKREHRKLHLRCRIRGGSGSVQRCGRVHDRRSQLCGGEWALWMLLVCLLVRGVWMSVVGSGL